MKQRRDWITVVVVAAVLAVGVMLAGTLVPDATGKASAAGSSLSPSPSPVLAVDHNGTFVKAYTLDQLEALTPFAGSGGYLTEGGRLAGPEPVTGVTISDVVQNALGVPLSTALSVDVMDVDPLSPYDETFTYNQLVTLAGLPLYDATTKKAVAPSSLTGPLAAVLIYSDPLQNVMNVATGEGPLRFVVVDAQNENAVMEGSDSVYAVNTLNVLDSVAKNWSLKFIGLKIKGKRQTDTISRNDFQSCSGHCHGSSYTVFGQKWSGTPLYLLVGEVDGGSIMTYNASLARRGYRNQLMSTTGKKRIVSSRAIIYKKKIILADEIDGAVLGHNLFPLRLIGPKLALSKSSDASRASPSCPCPRRSRTARSGAAPWQQVMYLSQLRTQCRPQALRAGLSPPGLLGRTSGARCSITLPQR